MNRFHVTLVCAVIKVVLMTPPIILSSISFQALTSHCCWLSVIYLVENYEGAFSLW